MKSLSKSLESLKKQALDTEWEEEFHAFVFELKNVTTKTIDKISRDRIAKNKSRVYWIYSKRDKNIEFMNSLLSAESDCDPDSFI